VIRSKPFIYGSWIPLLRNHINGLGSPRPAALHEAAAQCQAALKYEHFANGNIRRLPAAAVISIDVKHIWNALFSQPLLLRLAVRKHNKFQAAELQGANKTVPCLAKTGNDYMIFIQFLYPPFGKKGNKKEALG
jgi:hypothetical protein